MPVSAHRLGPGSLKFGLTGTAQEFAAQCISVKLSPSLDEEDPIDVLSGESLDGDDTLSYTIGGTLLQSYEKTGLLHWAHENKLAVLDFEFIPNSVESEYGWKGKAKIVPLEVGGDVKKRNNSDFEFKCVGEVTTYDLPA